MQRIFHGPPSTMALHTFFFTCPEELARPPVGMEVFKELKTQVR